MERFVLGYSAIWIAVVGGLEWTRAFSRWGDLGHLAIGVGLALPLWAAPFALERVRPLAARHASRFTLFIAISTFLQVGLGSQLFFDRLGMEYHFPVRLVLARTPLFLYFLTIAYFSSYFVVLMMAWRAFATRFPEAPRPLGWAVRALLSFGVAFAETFAMATPALAEWFRYRDRVFMLSWGSLAYGTVFFVMLPAFARLDVEPRTLRRVTGEALFANLLVLVCYLLYSLVLQPR